MRTLDSDYGVLFPSIESVGWFGLNFDPQTHSHARACVRVRRRVCAPVCFIARSPACSHPLAIETNLRALDYTKASLFQHCF
jgi:hypothetical protein